MLLTVKTRQKYLKHLGFYTGEIDGSAGRLTKAAYKKLQDKYFVRSSDRDGIYGKNTDILLRNAYNVSVYTRNFRLEEFKCNCKGKYCTGYPKVLDVQLLKNLQALRDRYGSVTITSGMRCQVFNDSLRGSVKNSYHIKGKAADFYVSVNKSVSGRKAVMSYWKTLKSAGYTYCNINGSAPNMGSAVHVQVK